MAGVTNDIEREQAFARLLLYIHTAGIEAVYILPSSNHFPLRESNRIQSNRLDPNTTGEEKLENSKTKFAMRSDRDAKNDRRLRESFFAISSLKALVELEVAQEDAEDLDRREAAGRCSGVDGDDGDSGGQASGKRARCVLA